LLRSISISGSFPGETSARLLLHHPSLFVIFSSDYSTLEALIIESTACTGKASCGVTGRHISPAPRRGRKLQKGEKTQKIAKIESCCVLAQECATREQEASGISRV
jgi:hypothetical protein